MSDLGILAGLYRAYFGEEVEHNAQLKGDGSARTLWRLQSRSASAIGVHGPDSAENRAFIGFSRTFADCGLPVPEIYAISDDESHYLEEDLGDTTLYDTVRSGRKSPEDLLAYYRDAVSWLVRFQIEGGREIDYSLCYQTREFGEEAVRKDIAYFRTMFIEQLWQGPFDSRSFERDMENLLERLLAAKREYFLYRDFQSRNIMLQSGKLRFIDYQSGRKGALYYDLASLLFDAKARLAPSVREEILAAYIKQIEQHMPVERERFMEEFHSYVLIRIMQALGAYGNLGYRQRKPGFLSSIPPAMENLAHLTQDTNAFDGLPYIRELSVLLLTISTIAHLGRFIMSELTVRIFSFGFIRSGPPVDETENGGGYVFDCRFLNNPGYERGMMYYTGVDKEIIDLLESDPEAMAFREEVLSMIDRVVRSYKEKEYTELYVAFGCTGGQHRSVYFAKRLADHLREQGVRVEIEHREKRHWP